MFYPWSFLCAREPTEGRGEMGLDGRCTNRYSALQMALEQKPLPASVRPGRRQKGGKPTASCARKTVRLIDMGPHVRWRETCYCQEKLAARSRANDTSMLHV